MVDRKEITACVDQSFLVPGGKYTVYRVVIQRLSNGNSEEKILYKRFSEFIKLHRRLSRVYQALDYNEPFPVLLKETYLNRFQSSVVEARLNSLDNFVKFIASNEPLYCHTYFTRFVSGCVSNHLRLGEDMSCRFSSQPSPPFPNLSLQIAPQIQRSPPTLPETGVRHLSLPQQSVVLEHLDSPLSSDTDSELEGESLPLVWESLAPPISEIICEIQAAKKFVCCSKWESAFNSYKRAISYLLNGLNSEADKKEEYQCLLSACIKKAEFIHRNFLMDSTVFVKKKEKEVHPSWVVSPNLASQCQDAALSNLFGSAEELSKLKICRIEGKDLVVCSHANTSVRYTLKSRSLPSKTRNQPIITITSANLKSSALSECILPVGHVAFMSPLNRLVESSDNRRLFLLVERPRGELRLVDWLSAYIHQRISTLLGPEPRKGSRLRRASTWALKHLSWCKARSVRFREMVALCLNTVDVAREGKKGDNDVNCTALQNLTDVIIPRGYDSSTSSSITSSEEIPHFGPHFASCLLSSVDDHVSRSHLDPFSPLLTPGVIWNKHPSWLLPPPSRSRSMDSIPFLQESFSSDDENCDHHQTPYEVSFLPERRSILWAAELVSVVSWLHSRKIILSHLNSSCVYLTQRGHIEVDYFFRWDVTTSDLESQLNADGDWYCHAPEMSLGAMTRSFLCGRTWETQVSCDWWSVGVILYEVFTGLRLQEVHPKGLTTATKLKLPPTLSAEVTDFLMLLLKLNIDERPSDSTVKHHPLFKSIDWARIESEDGR